MRKCRIARKTLAALCALALVLGMAPAALAAPAFSDVSEGQWFKLYTDKVVDAGLMNGMGDGSFAPDGHLTLGQAAVLAYQVHSKHSGQKLPQASGAWYMPYYQYCLDNQIFTESQVPLSEIDRKATRFEMVSILDKAVPDSQMPAINTLSNGFVPDLAEGDAYGKAVYKWYRAGILTGDDSHRFNGGSNITRAEVSVILCHLSNLVERIKIEAAKPTAPKAVTGVRVSIAKTSLKVEDTTTATAVITPSDAADKTVAWSSSNTKVAAVSKSGLVTAVGKGTATITATASNGVKGSATVTVAAAAAQDPQELIDEVVRLTNVERAKEGLPALETFDALDRAAAIRAPETVALFSHTRPDGSSCFTALDETGAKQGAFTYGENIAAGNATAADTVAQWMNSPGHRANILNKDFTHIGVGYATGGQYRYSWVQMFVGRRSTTPSVAVTGVKVNIAKTSLTVEDTTTATAVITPSNAADKTVAWSSSDTSVATVSKSGLVTAVGKGTATITATASNGVKGSQTVTVADAAAAAVTGVKVNLAKTSLTVDDTTTATAVITPSNAADKTVAWSSSDTSVATVSKSGQVTAVGKGTAAITATAANGVKGSATVTVSAAAPSQSPQELIDEVVRLTNVERAKEGLPALETFDALDRAAAIRAPETVALFSHTRPDGSSCFTALDETGAKQGAYTYGENIAAGNATAADTVAQWMNSPGHRANILNKDFTHIGVGYATGGQYRYSWVQMFVGRKSTTPSVAVTDVEVTISKSSLNVGETASASASVAPSNAADKTVAWSSSDSSVATVSKSGLVTAVGEGTATITAAAANGVKDSVVVAVAAEKKELTGLTLKPSKTGAMEAGDEISLTPVFTPADAEDKGLTWTSSNTSVATVSKNGVVTAVGEGSATITATAANGVEAEYTVAVNPSSSDEGGPDGGGGDASDPEDGKQDAAGGDKQDAADPDGGKQDTEA